MSSRTNTAPRRRTFPKAVIAGMTVFAIGFGAMAGLSIARTNALDSYSGCTVTEREDRAMAELAQRPPRIYTDCGVFVAADEPFRLHFTSADVYSALKPGATVDLTTVGWRVPLLSWLPNVIEVTQ